MLGKIGQEEKEVTEDEMVWWHHRLNGHEFEQTSGESEGQGSLMFCSPWDHKELDKSYQLNHKCLPIYLSIYLSIYTYIHIYKEIYCNSLSHVIIEAEKSHSLLYTSWRTRRAYGIIPVHVQRPGNQESWMCKFQAEFRRTSKSYYENTCIERAPFVLFRPLKTLDENPPATHLPPLPTHTQRKGKLLSESYLFRC